jgi:hypothetical protein
MGEKNVPEAVGELPLVEVAVVDETTVAAPSPA